LPEAIPSADGQPFALFASEKLIVKFDFPEYTQGRSLGEQAQILKTSLQNAEFAGSAGGRAGAGKELIAGRNFRWPKPDVTVR
jgi:hypothetical protein